MRQRTRRLEDWRAKRSGYGINMGEGSGGLQFSQGGDRWFSLFSVLEILTEMFFFLNHWCQNACTLHAGSRVRWNYTERFFLTPLLQAWVWMHSHVTCDGTRVHSRNSCIQRAGVTFLVFPRAYHTTRVLSGNDGREWKTHQRVNVLD